jgi:hypothetical protein
MSELLQLLKQLEQSRFYGSLEVKIEAGRVVLIRKTETLKPTEANYGDNRRQNEQFAK